MACKPLRAALGASVARRWYDGGRDNHGHPGCYSVHCGQVSQDFLGAVVYEWQSRNRGGK